MILFWLGFLSVAVGVMASFAFAILIKYLEVTPAAGVRNFLEEHKREVLKAIAAIILGFIIAGVIYPIFYAGHPDFGKAPMDYLLAFGFGFSWPELLNKSGQLARKIIG